MALGLGRSEIVLRGVGRRGVVRAAILVLSGANRRELRRATGLAGLLADRCILVAVDGGLRACRAARRRPDLFVGDGDSTKSVPEWLPAVRFPQDKSYSDLAGALREVRRRGARLVVVAGLLGGRLDHEWSNVQEVAAFAKHFSGILATTERGTVLVTSLGARVATPRGRVVSLFPLTGAANVSLTGVRWALSRETLRPGSNGLSNRTVGAMKLAVHRGTVALVFPVFG